MTLLFYRKTFAQVLIPPTIPTRLPFRAQAGNVSFTLHADESLVAKGLKPLASGDQIRGWLTYQVKDLTSAELQSPEIELSVMFFDITGKSYEVRAAGLVQKGIDELPALPGTEQPFRNKRTEQPLRKKKR